MKKITTIERLLNLKFNDEVIMYPTKLNPVDVFPNRYPTTEAVTRVVEVNNLDKRQIAFKVFVAFKPLPENLTAVYTEEKKPMTYAEIIESGRYWVY